MQGGASATLFLLVLVALTAAQSRSVWSGVYTDEQAAAGETIYFDRCVACHGDDLAGRERAPALAGRGSTSYWQSAGTTAPSCWPTHSRSDVHLRARAGAQGGSLTIFLCAEAP
jgi:mono/diheme cytochrome c family protein